MRNERNEEIVKFARDLKACWKTNDPFELAKIYGISVLFINSLCPGYTAQVFKSKAGPSIISIDKKYDEFSRRVLCAHELGHALLHEEGVNYFATTSRNLKTCVEGEANLFAIALLSDDNINDTLDIPLEKMSTYLLKSIVEYNIHDN